MQAHVLLVVDDEPASLRALRRTLGLDYRVLTASSGAEALSLLEREAISLLITDQRMPGMTGLELLARTVVPHPQLVRIVLTGYTEVDVLVEALNCGSIFYYLTKPWEPRELQLAVRRGLEHSEGKRERERLLQDLREACTRARGEAERSRRLLALAAHELGTPLHLASNAVDLLASSANAGECEWLGMAQRALAWLQRSLAQIKGAVHLGRTQVILRKRRIDVGFGLSRVVDALRVAVRERRLALDADLTPGLWIQGDDPWLRQVWIDLLSNGVRATPDGGRIRVCARADDTNVRVDVTDTGAGIEAERLATLFDSFSPAAGDLLLHTSGRFDHGAKGLGLGLWTARRVIELHGGGIEVESTPGRGSRFSVRLPRG